MATVTGQTGVVKIGTGNDNEAAVGEVRSFTLESSADTIEKTVMGDPDREYLAGQSSHTASIEAYWEKTDAGMLAMDSGASVFFEIHPTGTAAGELSYHGSGVVTSRNISASFDGMVEASFSIQVSGGVTETTNQ